MRRMSATLGFRSRKASIPKEVAPCLGMAVIHPSWNTELGCPPQIVVPGADGELAVCAPSPAELLTSASSSPWSSASDAVGGSSAGDGAAVEQRCSDASDAAAGSSAADDHAHEVASATAMLRRISQNSQQLAESVSMLVDTASPSWSAEARNLMLQRRLSDCPSLHSAQSSSACSAYSSPWSRSSAADDDDYTRDILSSTPPKMRSGYVSATGSSSSRRRSSLSGLSEPSDSSATRLRSMSEPEVRMTLSAVCLFPRFWPQSSSHVCLTPCTVRPICVCLQLRDVLERADVDARLRKWAKTHGALALPQKLNELEVKARRLGEKAAKHRELAEDAAAPPYTRALSRTKLNSYQGKYERALRLIALLEAHRWSAESSLENQRLWSRRPPGSMPCGETSLAPPEAITQPLVRT